jgi:hypothetical protein
MQLLGRGFDYLLLPAIHTRGGILLAWCSPCWAASSISSRSFSLSACMCQITNDTEWWLTVVYSLARDHDKQTFLIELHKLRTLHSGPWLLTRDFNLMYRAEDKNNTRLDRRLMGQFRRFLDEASLHEIHLSGIIFTWSNERSHPTLEHIDHAFISKEWDEFYPSHDLTSLVSMCSDHAPLLLRASNEYKHHKRFHFKAY